MDNKVLDQVAMWLVVIGGLNWGLAVFDMNLVNLVLGTIPVLEKVVYALVGLSALLMAFNAFRK